MSLRVQQYVAAFVIAAVGLAGSLVVLFLAFVFYFALENGPPVDDFWARIRWVPVVIPLGCASPPVLYFSSRFAARTLEIGGAPREARRVLVVVLWAIWLLFALWLASEAPV